MLAILGGFALADYWGLAFIWEHREMLHYLEWFVQGMGYGDMGI